MTKKHFPSSERLISLIEDEFYMGVCLSCGFEQEGVEPDARAYECDDCGALEVYGAEEILFMTES